MASSPRMLIGTPALQRLLRYGSVVEGFIAVAFISGNAALLHITPSMPLLLAAFCGTFLIYQYERAHRPAPEDAFNQPDRLRWAREHERYVRYSSIAAVLIGLGTVPFLRPGTLLAAAGLGLLGMFHVAPLTPAVGRLKSVWYLKSVLISSAWAAGGVLVPAVEAGTSITEATTLLLLGYRFLFVLPNALLTDWPDREGDRRTGLSTAATRFSSRSLRRCAAAALLTSLLAGLILAGTSPSPALVLIDLGGPLVMLVFLQYFPFTSPARYRGLDFIVAWPALTALFATFVI